jgi:hypothetical protein
MKAPNLAEIADGTSVDRTDGKLKTPPGGCHHGLEDGRCITVYKYATEKWVSQ